MWNPGSSTTFCNQKSAHVTLGDWIRLNKYLNNDDVSPDAVKHDSQESDPMVIEGGSFSWGKDEPTVLHDVNVREEDAPMKLNPIIANVMGHP